MNKEDIIKLNDGDYFVLATLMYKDEEYGFVNKIDSNDEVLNEYKIVIKENNDYKVIEDESIISELLPLFEETLTKEVLDMQKSGEL